MAFIVLGAFAFLYVMSDSRLVTAGATPGYRGAAQDTGYLADGYANGVGVAWQMNAADAGLDRIDDYAAADGRLFLVGYRGSQRVAIGYDASSAKPRELWRTNLTDDEPGSYWWEGGPPRGQHAGVRRGRNNDHGLADADRPLRSLLVLAPHAQRVDERARGVRAPQLPRPLHPPVRGLG